MISILAASILTMLPPLVWNAEGRAEAERDIAANTMKWKIYGHMAGLTPTDEAARSMLRKRFGVELEVVAFCEVTEELVERTKGYNDRIREEIDRKHGADAVDHVWKEAHQESQIDRVVGGWLMKALVVAGGVAGLWVCARMLVGRLCYDLATCYGIPQSVTEFGQAASLGGWCERFKRLLASGCG